LLLFPPQRRPIGSSPYSCDSHINRPLIPSREPSLYGGAK
jgi:hypothetical protein